MNQTFKNFVENLAKDENIIRLLKRYQRLEEDSRKLVVNREFGDYEARKILVNELHEKRKVEENNLRAAILDFFVMWCTQYLYADYGH